MRHALKRIIISVTSVALCLSMLFSPSVVSAISAGEYKSLITNAPFYDPLSSAVCSTSILPGSPNSVGSNVFVLGDSLAVSMVRDAGLLGDLRSAGYAVDTVFTSTPDNIGFATTRLQGGSVEATNGINVALTIPRIQAEADAISNSGKIIISLGTNREPGFAGQVASLANSLRQLNPSLAIYWLNTYTRADSSWQAVNAELATAAAANNITVIDWATEAAANPARYPFTSDNVHHTAVGDTNKAAFVTAAIGAAAPGGTVPSPTFDAYSLTYPNFPDEAALALKLDEFIREKSPNSPYLTIPNFSADLIAEAKRVNTNPLIPLFIAKQESQLGTSSVASALRGNPPRINYNSFGDTSSPDVNDDGYKEYPSFRASFIGPGSFTERIPIRIASHPNYAEVETLGDYLSVHVSGRIIHPGDPTRIYDPRMGQYVDSAAVQVYLRNVSNWILQVTGQTVGGSNTGSSTTCSILNAGNPLPAGANGYDLPGEGPNPMIYYSQMRGCPGGRDCNQQLRYFGDQEYGTGALGIGNLYDCGCAPTSLAMIIATLTGSGVTPVETADWLARDYQDADCGTDSSFLNAPNASFTQTFGVSYSTITPSAIADALTSGKLVLMSVNNSAYPTPNPDDTGGHYVVIRQITPDGQFLMADPFAYGWEGVQDASNTPFSIDQISGMVRTGIWAFSRT